MAWPGRPRGADWSGATYHTDRGTREAGVLYVFGFERTGVAVGDLYFADPDPPPGQEGA